MRTLLALPIYGVWHYTRAYVDLWNNWKHFFFATFRFFSIPLLIRTLFSPWRRLNDSYKKGLDPGAFFETFMVNVLMRAVGFVIRVITLVIGVAALFLLIVLGMVCVVIWTILPFLVLIFIGLGLGTLTS